MLKILSSESDISGKPLKTWIFSSSQKITFSTPEFPQWLSKKLDYSTSFWSLWMQNLNLLWFEVQSFLEWNQKGRICKNAIIMHNTKVEKSQNCLSTSVQLSMSSSINWAHGGSPSFMKLSGVGCVPPHKSVTNCKSFLPLKHIFLQCGLKAKGVWLFLRELWHPGGTGHPWGSARGCRAVAPAGHCCCSARLENPRNLMAKQLEPQKCQGQTADPEYSASPTWAGLQTSWNLPLNNWK